MVQKILRSLSVSSKPKNDLEHFSQMSRDERQALAAMLCHQPEPAAPRDSEWWLEYSSSVKLNIPKLPFRLQSTPGVVSKFIAKRADASTIAKSRDLCYLHFSLNRKAVRSTLRWIRKEVDLNIPAVATPLIQAGKLSEESTILLNRLQNVSGMWSSSRSFERFVGYPVPDKWKRQKDLCAACIIARMFGDLEMLTATIAGLAARYPEDHVSKRGEYLEAAVDRHGPEAQFYCLTRAVRVAKELRGHIQQQTNLGGNISTPLPLRGQRLTPKAAGKQPCRPANPHAADPNADGYHNEVQRMINEYRDTTYSVRDAQNDAPDPCADHDLVSLNVEKSSQGSSSPRSANYVNARKLTVEPEDFQGMNTYQRLGINPHEMKCGPEPEFPPLSPGSSRSATQEDDGKDFWKRVPAMCEAMSEQSAKIHAEIMQRRYANGPPKDPMEDLRAEVDELLGGRFDLSRRPEPPRQALSPQDKLRKNLKLPPKKMDHDLAPRCASVTDEYMAGPSNGSRQSTNPDMGGPFFRGGTPRPSSVYSRPTDFGMGTASNFTQQSWEVDSDDGEQRMTRMSDFL